MLSGGPSVLYAEKIVSRQDGLVIITGYQDEEAPGRALLQLAEAAEAFRTSDPDAGAQPPSLSADTGWRMVISRAVLQNQVLPLAAQIAERAGFTLVKSPSYMPVTREIQLKVSSFNPDAQASVISEITEQTGLSCKILIM